MKKARKHRKARAGDDVGASERPNPKSAKSSQKENPPGKTGGSSRKPSGSGSGSASASASRSPRQSQVVDQVVENREPEEQDRQNSQKAFGSASAGHEQKHFEYVYFTNQ